VRSALTPVLDNGDDYLDSDLAAEAIAAAAIVASQLPGSAAITSSYAPWADPYNHRRHAGQVVRPRRAHGGRRVSKAGALARQRAVADRLNPFAGYGHTRRQSTGESTSREELWAAGCLQAALPGVVVGHHDRTCGQIGRPAMSSPSARSSRLLSKRSNAPASACCIGTRRRRVIRSTTPYEAWEWPGPTKHGPTFREASTWCPTRPPTGPAPHSRHRRRTSSMGGCRCNWPWPGAQPAKAHHVRSFGKAPVPSRPRHRDHSTDVHDERFLCGASCQLGRPPCRPR